MGGIFGKGTPLVTLSCINVRDAGDVNISRVDGKGREEEEEKEKIRKIFCFRIRKKKDMAEEKKKIHLKKEEIESLVSLYEEKKKKKPKKITNDFKVSKKRDTYNERVKLREKVYHLSIARHSSASFIVFIQSLSVVFNYLLNAARAAVNSEDDYVRFIFSHAPSRYFSTCVLPLKEFSVEYFMNSF